MKPRVEFEQLGFNVTTLGLIGTTFFTFVSAWGLGEQWRQMARHRSGESVSVAWFTNTACLYAAGLIYGVSIQSAPLVINGTLLGALHLPILCLLWRYKGFTRTERIFSLVFAAAVVPMFFFEKKGVFLLALSLTNIVFSLNQPLEIWRKKNAGMLSIRLLGAYFFSSAFWNIYAYAKQDWVLMLVSPFYLAILIVTILLWLKYRQSPCLSDAVWPAKNQTPR